MKKLLTGCVILLALACNSADNNNSTGTGNESDSLRVGEEDVLKNDVPMRTVDTSKNLMMDTTNPRDTVTTP